MAEVGRRRLTQRRVYRKSYEILQFYNAIKKYTWKDNGIHVMKIKGDKIGNKIFKWGWGTGFGEEEKTVGRLAKTKDI